MIDRRSEFRIFRMGDVFCQRIFCIWLLEKGCYKRKSMFLYVVIIYVCSILKQGRIQEFVQGGLSPRWGLKTP